MATVRDKLWLWGHDAGSHNIGWNAPAESRITPVEGAYYMDVPNVIMVRYGPASMAPTDQYIVPFKALDNVVWSIVGGSGCNTDEETTYVITDLPKKLPNLTGVMMDDFFRNTKSEADVATYTLDQLKDVQGRLSASGRKLDMWVVLYTHQLDPPVKNHLALCDKVALWTWHSSDLKDLEANFAKAEELAPAAGKVLGCYMWDYGEKHPMATERMQHQCELGLKWLREGRIEGMIFLASCICDLGVETVEWTRDWIAKVGDKKL